MTHLMQIKYKYIINWYLEL